MHHTKYISALLLFFIVSAAVHAQGLTITLTPATVTGAAGEVVFSGQLLNTTTGTLSLDGIGFTFDGSGGYLSDEQNDQGINKVFFDSVPVSLGAGESYQGDIFGLNVAPGTPGGVYGGAVTISGSDGTAPYAASQNFQVLVAPAPEPSALAALSLGALGLAGLALRARRRDAQS